MTTTEITLAKTLLKTYTMSGFEERRTTTERRSDSAKSYWAGKKLKKLLGFDIGDISNLTPEQDEIRNKIYN